MSPQLDIRVCTEADILPLERQIPSSGASSVHAFRYARQQDGRSTYLVAWLEGLPVGHLDLRWDGVQGCDAAQQHLAGCPELNGIVVLPERRSQGIGTRLISAAETMARQRGFHAVCVGVALENDRARALYERLGYVAWDRGVVDAYWVTVDAQGRETRHAEQCLYLQKVLLQTLADLMPSGGRKGAGIVARHDGRLLFVAERTERPEGELACIRVGGGCREEESLADCAVRKARGETGCEVSLHHSEQTFMANEHGDITAHALDDSPAPLLVYTTTPFLSSYTGLYHNALFAASLVGAPRPGPEAETLLLLSDEALLALAEGPRPLHALIAAGARVESINPPCPEATVFAEGAPRHLAALLRRGVRIG